VLEVRMAGWGDLEQDSPDLAAEGRRLLYQFGVGLAFLATIRKDGGPRLHPICPVIAEGGLYAFINRSPKLNDLRRNGQYALHFFLPADVDDEFYVTGTAREVSDPQRRESIRSACKHPVADDEVLFEFDIHRCLLAKYEARGVFPPAYTRWGDPAIR
jgi:hypothetical protein